MIFDKKYIINKLKTFNSPTRLCLKDDSFVKSAIVFLIVPYSDKHYDLILIRRTNRDNDKHAGEMSFPGGVYDAKIDITLQDTAIRENEEELGISRENVNILGCLDDHITPKNFIITPFVGYINEKQKMVKQEVEVKEIVKIPIKFFANKENYKERVYKLYNDTIAVGKYSYRAPNNKKYVIFGATSHIIVNFIDLVYNLGLMKIGTRRLTCKDLENKK